MSAGVPGAFCTGLLGFTRLLGTYRLCALRISHLLTVCYQFLEWLAFGFWLWLWIWGGQFMVKF